MATKNSPTPRYTLRLAAVGNPDFGQPQNIGIPTKLVQVADLAAAQRECLAFLARHDLGGGNWAGGQITDPSGAEVARISYNGRAWAPNDTEIHTLR